MQYFCYACSNQPLDQRDYANTDTPTKGNNDEVNKIRQNPQSVDVTGYNVITDRNHSHTNEPQNRWSDMCLVLKNKRWLLRFLQNILTALLFQQFNIAFTSCEKHFLMKMTAIITGKEAYLCSQIHENCTIQLCLAHIFGSFCVNALFA